MKNEKLYATVLLALFTAIIFIMAFTPLGYIPLVVINATIIHIPVILGSLFLGPKKGAFLGFIFGLTSFLNNTFRSTSLSAFVFSPVLAYGIVGWTGILKSLVICFIPRILVGIFPYYVFRLFDRISDGRTKGARTALRTAGFFAAGLAGAFTNTLFVMSGIYVLYKTPYAAALKISEDAVLGAIWGIVSFNGILEALVAGILITGIGTVLVRFRPVFGSSAAGKQAKAAEAGTAS